MSRKLKDILSEKVTPSWYDTEFLEKIGIRDMADAFAIISQDLKQNLRNYNYDASGKLGYEHNKLNRIKALNSIKSIFSVRLKELMNKYNDNISPTIDLQLDKIERNVD